MPGYGFSLRSEVQAAGLPEPAERGICSAVDQGRNEELICSRPFRQVVNSSPFCGLLFYTVNKTFLFREERSTSEGQEQAERGSLWASFDTQVERSRSLAAHATDPVEVEVEKYLQQPNEPRHTEPLNWWKDRADLKGLSKIAAKYLLVQGTSVPSERVFSAAGNILNAKRSRMNDDNASMFIFLNGNM